jgi:hypothetical protein
MARYRVVVLTHVNEGVDSETRDRIREWFFEKFIPAERRAPGLKSIEMCTPYTGRIPHHKDGLVNSASEFCFVELWKDPESNHEWWNGDIFNPRDNRLREVMLYFKDCHFTVDM